MKLRYIKTSFFLVVVAPLLWVGCGGDDTTDPTPTVCNRATQAGFTSLIVDSCGDGAQSALLDGTRLSFRYDNATDSLWFLQSVNAVTASQAIGVNIMVNIPGGGSTFNFWGDNNKNAFHKLLTVWVTGSAPSSYSGQIGIANAQGVELGNTGGPVESYINESQNNISIHVNTDTKTLLMGLKRTHLIPDSLFTGSSISVNIASAVGSNDAWNDDLYASSATMTLTKAVVSGTIPTLTTSPLALITHAGATGGGTISSNGGQPITERGLCWSKTNPNPTLADAFLAAPTNGTGDYSLAISGLRASTQYFVRAYAKNAIGVAYGSPAQTFTTLAPVLPTVATNPASSITKNSALLNGTVSSDGGGDITENGFYIGTSSALTTANGTKIVATAGAGNFSKTASGLTPNMVYYVFAFATNAAGTAYGSILSFTSGPDVPIMLMAALPTKKRPTYLMGGGIGGLDMGSPITDKGLCWSKTNPNPTTSNSKASAGSGNTAFTVKMAGLTPNTTYYVRAYATNAVGTGYSDPVQWTTVPAYILGQDLEGGRVYQINPDGSSGRIAGPIDLTGIWGCPGAVINGLVDDEGAGQANTTKILAVCAVANSAAKICNDYSVGGYSDWYLPSRADMQKINEVNYDVQALGQAWIIPFGISYWSSSQCSATEGRILTVATGHSCGTKDQSKAIRPVRDFD